MRSPLIAGEVLVWYNTIDMFLRQKQALLHIIVTTIVVLAALFSVHVGMVSISDMSFPCPITGHEMVMCPFDSLGHLASWQQLFLAILPTAVAMLALVFIAAYRSHALIFSYQLSCSSDRVWYWYYRHKRAVFKLFTPLERYIRCGLLHPQFYA